MRIFCPACAAPLFDWHLWPRRGSGFGGREVGVTQLTCRSCGDGYVASTLATILIYSVGVAGALVLLTLQGPALYWAGRSCGRALRHIAAGELVAPLGLGLAGAAGIIALGVMGIVVANQAVTVAAWRLGAFRPESGGDAIERRVRVEHRGKPSMRGYLDEAVLVDGEVVGPSVPAGPLGLAGCRNWYRVREDGEVAEYDLRCWGTGRDVAHALFRNGELWSEKRSGSLSGLALEPILVRRIRTPGPPPGGAWEPAGPSSDGLRVLRPGPAPSDAPPDPRASAAPEGGIEHRRRS